MTASELADVRRMVADIAQSVARLPETRPSLLPAAGRAALADLLHACDVLILALAGQTAPQDAAGLLETLRAYRRLLFLLLADLEPEEMPGRMDAARDQDATTAARMASGLIPRFFTDQQFDVALRALWLEDPDA